MPLSTLSCTIDSSGISAPNYNAILESLRESIQAIYGSDVYIEPDSQDGQFIAIWARAIDNNNQAMIATFLNYSPTYAQGVGLSSEVKINGIQRQSPSFSTAVGDVIGAAGTNVIDGVVEDTNGNLWNLPTPTLIPVGGLITVTATAQLPGAIVAEAGSINKINNPTRGWQSFTSTADSDVGAPVESDAVLRRRQTLSTGLPAQNPIGAMLSVIINLPGVTRARAYENYTGVEDDDGLPAHSESMVVEGGDVQSIVNAIGLKKTPGAATYGTTSGIYIDPISGIIYTMRFFVLDKVDLEIVITGDAKNGYSSVTEDAIKTALVNYISAHTIGEDVQYLRLFAPAYLNGSIQGRTYEITALTVNISGDAPGVIDIPIDFNQAAVLASTDITITIT